MSALEWPSHPPTNYPRHPPVWPLPSPGARHAPRSVLLGRGKSRGWAQHRAWEKWGISFKIEPEVILTGSISPPSHIEPQGSYVPRHLALPVKRWPGMSRSIFEFLNKALKKLGKKPQLLTHRQEFWCIFLPAISSAQGQGAGSLSLRGSDTLWGQSSLTSVSWVFSTHPWCSSPDPAHSRHSTNTDRLERRQPQTPASFATAEKPYGKFRDHYYLVLGYITWCHLQQICK